jgi:peptidoglycan-N-acetylglucosamine deacetylase
LAVALTFDDGPDAHWTPQLLSTLARLGARGTFFVQGERLVEHPEVARAALSDGHELQPHCFEHRSHRSMSRADVREDLDRVLGALRDLAGVERPTLWRPPYGHVQPHSRDVAAERGLELVTWTLQTCDWGGRSAEQMWSEIELEQRSSAVLRGDSVVIMHDPVGRETVRLLDRLIPEILRRGFSIEPLRPGVETPEDPFDDCRG